MKASTLENLKLPQQRLHLPFKLKLLRAERPHRLRVRRLRDEDSLDGIDLGVFQLGLLRRLGVVVPQRGVVRPNGLLALRREHGVRRLWKMAEGASQSVRRIRPKCKNGRT